MIKSVLHSKTIYWINGENWPSLIFPNAIFVVFCGTGTCGMGKYCDIMSLKAIYLI